MKTYTLSWQGDGYCRDTWLVADTDEEAIKTAKAILKNAPENYCMLFDDGINKIWDSDEE